jgi:hypothetical protein
LTPPSPMQVPVEKMSPMRSQSLGISG